MNKKELKARLKLTDEEFLEWCGSHMVKGCKTKRIMIDEGEEVREVEKCEDCRAEAQLDKVFKADLAVIDREKGLKGKSIVTFKPCDCFEVQGKVTNVSAPSLGGERMILIEYAGEKFERLEHEIYEIGKWEVWRGCSPDVIPLSELKEE